MPAPITHGSPGRRRIALTFDADMTAAMLRRLAAHEVDTYANPAIIDELQASDTPATFFLTGMWVDRYPDQTRRLAADPRFELASHSWDHRGFTASCYGLGTLPAEMAAKVERSFTELAPFGGRQTHYFRFPGGCYDTAALRAIAPIHATVLHMTKGNAPRTADALPVIGSLRARGFSLVRHSDLLHTTS